MQIVLTEDWEGWWRIAKFGIDVGLPVIAFRKGFTTRDALFVTLYAYSWVPAVWKIGHEADEYRDALRHTPDIARTRHLCRFRCCQAAAFHSASRVSNHCCACGQDLIDTRYRLANVDTHRERHAVTAGNKWRRCESMNRKLSLARGIYRAL